MAASSGAKKSGLDIRKSSAFQKSISPSTSFCSSSSSLLSSPSSGFYLHSPNLLRKSPSPTRITLFSPSSSLKFPRHHHHPSSSPSRSINISSSLQESAKKQATNSNYFGNKKTCMCSPTSHPGSFRCSLHRKASPKQIEIGRGGGSPYRSNKINEKRSAMTNSLVRIGSVEGDLVKSALAILIRPSSHQQRRKAAFERRPSRLSVMSRAEDL